MEKKANVENSMQKKGLWILKSLLCAYLVTGVLLLILTVLLYKCGLEEKHVSAGIFCLHWQVVSWQGKWQGSGNLSGGLESVCCIFCFLY